MSTTVIVSSVGDAALVAARWSAPALDTTALAKVLSAHGLSLLPGTTDANEVIAAEGLAPARAAALADDLRAAGFTARVVNRTGLTQSRRVGNALTVAFVVAVATLPFATLGVALDKVPDVMAWLAVPGLFFVLNALAIARRGGTHLAVAGAVAEPQEHTEVDRLLDGLRDQLPDHLLAPIVEQARRLQAEAARDPEGPAAAELASLLAEEGEARRERVAEDARTLGDALRRARAAVAETGNRR
ncbi:MAG: hypothetical protein H6738_03455 [Alphaproteobacteria bacterium]|nr:hypothetical protein [Alphaproteobacteria bacterium]MCB9695824.1 hypothetical protein [Alphaproteobacteria bacterium]